jgi:hypothetical protein
MNLPKEKLLRVISPPAEQTQHDTGLRFTDILFGFVISQIFLRLQHWGHLSSVSRWQLICSTVLVLGSWIGFRRSLNRSEYELKFFNLPLFRFMLDQAMLVLYFRVATLTPLNPTKEVNVPQVTHDTVKALVFIFVLYLAWDLLGQVMAWLTKKYTASKRDLAAPFITALALGGCGYLLHVVSAGSFNASMVLAVSTGILVAYRWLKEARSGWAWKPREEPRHCLGCDCS